MSFNFSNDKPIFLQIEECIKNKIISGEIAPGEKLKSVRELSSYFKVNPNTVQSALKNLEELGLIFTDRTNGKFVSTDNKIIIKNKEQQISTITNEFISNMKSFGLDNQQIINYIKEHING